MNRTQGPLFEKLLGSQQPAWMLPRPIELAKVQASDGSRESSEQYDGLGWGEGGRDEATFRNARCHLRAGRGGGLFSLGNTHVQAVRSLGSRRVSGNCPASSFLCQNRSVYPDAKDERS